MPKYSLLLGLLAIGWLGCHVQAQTSIDLGPLELFEQRIMPIFESDKPSSCVQCHLASVDLKDYIRPSSRETFLALRAAQLIDIERPAQSKILNLIEMGELDPDPLAVRIHQKTRQAEHAAFAAWIAACCRDAELLTAEYADVDASGPAIDPEAIRYSRKDRVLDSFVRNVWSQRMRCFPCHTPHEIKPENEKARKRHADFVAKYGQRMNLFRATPAETLRAWSNSSRRPGKSHLPLVNLAEPAESLILLKPTAKLPPKQEDGKLGKPSSLVPVSHVGGLKMHVGDASYKAWRTWIEDFAHIKSAAFETGQPTPRDNWYPTQQVLRIKGTPESWPKLALVQLFVYAKDPEKATWSESPVAFTQSLVTPRGMVNGPLFLLASEEQHDKWQAQGQRLQPGEYRIRAYVDREGRLEKEPSLLLFDQIAHDGQLTIQAQWRDGFPNAEIVEGAGLQIPADHDTLRSAVGD